ncbi:MAG: pilus assembly protein [Syntrophomonadaceae bacterium]|nr:pilus assembly protein [Syntrophomonadaceae bacterium]
MIRTVANFWREERGAVLVLVAAAMVVLLGFTALVTDFGLMYLNKSRLANAIDAGVLAGVQELPNDPSAAEAVAQQYAQANGAKEGEVSFSVSADRRQITGTGTRAVNLFFAQALGIYQGNVAARAAARLGPLSSVDRGVVPFSVEKPVEGTWFTYGEQVTLKVGHGERGWFQCLRLPGNSGANDLRRDIKYGYQGTLKVGDIVSQEPGNMSGPVNDGVEYRMNQCPHTPRCTYQPGVTNPKDGYHPDCPRVVIVPVVEVYSEHDKTVKIVGFASFLLEGSGGNGSNNYVTGRFVTAEGLGGIDDSLSDYGAYGVKLSE